MKCLCDLSSQPKYKLQIIHNFLGNSNLYSNISERCTNFNSQNLWRCGMLSSSCEQWPLHFSSFSPLFALITSLHFLNTCDLWWQLLFPLNNLFILIHRNYFYRKTVPDATYIEVMLQYTVAIQLPACLLCLVLYNVCAFIRLVKCDLIHMYFSLFMYKSIH